MSENAARRTPQPETIAAFDSSIYEPEVPASTQFATSTASYFPTNQPGHTSTPSPYAPPQVTRSVTVPASSFNAAPATVRPQAPSYPKSYNAYDPPVPTKPYHHHSYAPVTQPTPSPYGSASLGIGFIPPTAATLAESEPPTPRPQPQRAVSTAYDPPFLRTQEKISRPASAVSTGVSSAYAVSSIVPPHQVQTPPPPPSGPPKRSNGEIRPPSRGPAFAPPPITSFGSPPPVPPLPVPPSGPPRRPTGINRPPSRGPVHASHPEAQNSGSSAPPLPTLPVDLTRSSIENKSVACGPKPLDFPGFLGATGPSSCVFSHEGGDGVRSPSPGNQAISPALAPYTASASAEPVQASLSGLARHSTGTTGPLSHNQTSAPSSVTHISDSSLSEKPTSYYSPEFQQKARESRPSSYEQISYIHEEWEEEWDADGGKTSAQLSSYEPRPHVPSDSHSDHETETFKTIAPAPAAELYEPSSYAPAQSDYYGPSSEVTTQPASYKPEPYSPSSASVVHSHSQFSPYARTTSPTHSSIYGTSPPQINHIQSMAASGDTLMHAPYAPQSAYQSQNESPARQPTISVNCSPIPPSTSPYAPSRSSSNYNPVALPAQTSTYGMSPPSTNYFQSLSTQRSASVDTSYVPQQVLEQKPISDDSLGRTTLAARNAPIAVFGFGGVLITAFPGASESDDFAKGHSRIPSYGYASGRGQLWIRNISELVAPGALKSDQSAFPGPLVNDVSGTKGTAGEKKKKEAVLTYLRDRAEEVERGLPYLKSSASRARREDEGKLVLLRLLEALVLGEGKLAGK